MNAALLSLIEATLNGIPAVVEPHPRQPSMVLVRSAKESAAFPFAAVKAAARQHWNFRTKEQKNII